MLKTHKNICIGITGGRWDTARSLPVRSSQSVWAVETENIVINAIVNINMIHIAPWSACLALMAGASRILSPGGILYRLVTSGENIDFHYLPRPAHTSKTLAIIDNIWYWLSINICQF